MTRRARSSIVLSSLFRKSHRHRAANSVKLCVVMVLRPHVCRYREDSDAGLIQVATSVQALLPLLKCLLKVLCFAKIRESRHLCVSFDCYSIVAGFEFDFSHQIGSGRVASCSNCSESLQY
jgi:hypothetical protein